MDIKSFMMQAQGLVFANLLMAIILRRGVQSQKCSGLYNYFVQLGFNLSNGVTDTLESGSILIYLETRKSIYTQRSG